MKIKPSRNIMRNRKKILSLIIFSTCVQAAPEYYFDPSLFSGTSLQAQLEEFNQTNSKELTGEQFFDIYLNDAEITKNTKVDFEDLNGTSTPCIPSDIIPSLGIKTKLKSEKNKSCVFIKEINEHIHWNADYNTFKLNLYIPRKYLSGDQYGTVPETELNRGDPVFFSNYNGNVNYTDVKSNGDNKYAWMNLNLGLNLDLLELRHNGSYSYSKTGGNSSRSHYSSQNTYAQIPIKTIDSILKIGDTTSSSTLFSSVSFVGMTLMNDTRMRSQNRQGYVPDIRGFATTAARVIVKQNNQVLYETSVPPGEFIIDDINRIPGSGDLNVQVIESNGKTSEFTVPYVSITSAVRPGNINYKMSLGKVKNYDKVENRFVETSLEYGMNNFITTTTGMRLNEKYQALQLGSVLSTQMGSFGSGMTWSRANLNRYGVDSGWQMQVNYSNSFSSGTNVVIGAYRYSTSGYREFIDTLGILKLQATNKNHYQSSTLNQRSRIAATVNQTFGDWGQVFLSAGTSDYYSNKRKEKDLQFGYSNSIKSVSFSMSVNRQKAYNDDGPSRYENFYSFNTSIPFSVFNTNSMVSYNYNSSDGYSSNTVTASGSLNNNSNISYSTYIGSTRSNGESNQTYGFSAQKIMPVATASAGISAGKDYKQYSAGMSGSLVAHSGGVTLGNYLGDSFAIVYAKNAKGAVVKNSNGAEINRFGYAILPGLNPYRWNEIALETGNLSDNVEIDGGSIRVAPYSGVMVKATFNTKKGIPVLFNLIYNNKPIPMGASILSEDGKNIGMVGQAGQAFVLLADTTGKLKIVWGNESQSQCFANYSFTENVNNNILTMALPCK